MQRPASTSDIDAVLRRLARPQLGLVTLDQLSQAGIDHSAITRRRAAGALDVVFAGVLRLDAAPTAPEQRTLAAALAVPGSVVAASSAAQVTGMPVSARSVPIVTTGQARSARTAGIVTVRSQFVLPSRRWHTARVATPEATLVMLPRFETDEMVERCLDHCLAHRPTTVERVSDLIGSLPPRAVVGRRMLTALVDARTGASVIEVVSNNGWAVGSMPPGCGVGSGTIRCRSALVRPSKWTSHGSMRESHSRSARLSRTALGLRKNATSSGVVSSWSTGGPRSRPPTRISWICHRST